MLEATPAWLEESYSRLVYTRHAGGHVTPAVAFKNASKPVMDTAKLYSTSEAQTLTMAEFVNYVSSLVGRRETPRGASKGIS